MKLNPEEKGVEKRTHSNTELIQKASHLKTTHLKTSSSTWIHVLHARFSTLQPINERLVCFSMKENKTDTKPTISLID